VSSGTGDKSFAVTELNMISEHCAAGCPQIAPVWFDLDGNDLILMTRRDTVKGRNFLRDPRVMLSIDDERNAIAS
jgi:nitroimidazol reductase NimA-like FMN-containing flavoprotein (pyridoxamine 5'-phosphate oxidase superfamily)